MRWSSIVGQALVAVVCLALGGCATWPNKSAESIVHIRCWTMWSGGEEKAFQAVLDRYNETHPGVRFENLGSVNDEKTVRALVAGAPPDVFTVSDPSYLGALAANDAILPLDDLFEKSHLKTDDFTRASLSQARYNGKLYAMPYLVDCIGLLWNKKVFREAGLDPERPPQTIEELEEFCRKITQKGADGRLTRIGLRPPDGVNLLALYGGGFFEPATGRITANNPRNIEAATAFKALMDAQGGYEAVQGFAAGFANEQGGYNSFYVGQAGMVFSGQWNTYWIAKYKPDTEYGVAPLPYPAAHPERKGTLWLGGNFFCIPKESRHKKEAWDFLVWTQSLEAQRLLADSLHGVPNIRAALKIRSLREGEPWRVSFGKFMDLSDSPNATHFPPMPIAALYLSEINSAIEAVGYGRKTPEKALSDTQERVQREMDRYR